MSIFAELERRGDRQSEDYRSKERQLARSLDLAPQWWTGCSVLDKSDGPIHASSQYIAHQDWHRCREVRLALLAALDAQGK